MPEYSTMVRWDGAHRGELSCSNGAVMPFSAPAALHGESGVLTPEDAFVGALNTCFMLMFIWAVERLKIDLVSYDCEAVGEIKEFLDKTSTFNRVTLRPRIEARSCRESDVERALKLAEKYSLVWNSIRSEVLLEPEINIHS
ncbi:OsmC family peroxiredoxin [Candidatus Bathyarchaeota archaeon]|nr:OsmC family peroxiredoxin [Candidatus Bathyarchaeota archaeon]